MFFAISTFFAILHLLYFAQIMIVEFMRGLASVNLIVVFTKDVIVAERLAVVMFVFMPFVASFASNVKLP